MKGREYHGHGGLFLPVLYALVILALLVLTVVGGRLYAGLTENRQSNDDQRGTLTYLQTRVAAADQAGGVRVEAGPEGTALVLEEAGTDYETRIYLYEGQLVEELSAHASAFSPEWGTAICPVHAFDVEVLDGGVLAVTADGQRALICLHSEGGGAHETD